MVEKAKTKGEEILDKPLPRMVDDIWEGIKQALDAASRSEKAAAISQEAAKEARKAAQEEAAKAAEAAKADVLAELKPEIDRLDKKTRELVINIASLFPIFGIISDIFIKNGEAKMTWGNQIRAEINKAKLTMGITP